MNHPPLLPLVLAFAFAAPAAELAAGQKLPELKGEYLTGRKATFPKDSAGRITLLLFGFSYQSRFAVENWTKRFRQDFGNHPDVTFFEIPMIGGLARMGRWFIDSGMRRGTPKADHENVITVYGGTGEWKQRLGVVAEDTAHVVLLDRAGTIVWRHSGPLDDARFQHLAAKVRTLVSP